jgi:hypothetical protein
MKKTTDQIVSDWENTKMTKKEIVKHFVEICKMDEVLMKDKDQDFLDLRHEKNEKIANLKSERDHFLSEIHRNYDFLKNLEKKMEANFYKGNCKYQDIKKVRRHLNSFYK